ncbi:T/G mismatch-specific endonuclease [Prevotella sp. KH2C16]|nr:T/G mismatch-specific endonuclease [Prevotella sp. KH2C16]
MAAIKSKGTKPELLVRRYLWAQGFRYRLNSPRLPGHPDLVLRKYRTCIFVNGCFWHGHRVHVMAGGGKRNIESSGCCKIPHTNREFWVNKILRNRERDIEEQKQLAAMGWHCITVWECELKPKVREETLRSLAFTLNHIFLQDHSYRRMEEEQELDMAAEPQP